MRTTVMFMAGTLVLSGAAVARAQAPSGGPSGTWTGVLERDDGGRTTARIELRVQGRQVHGLVTGPQLIPGDIVDGSFDPQSGALRFTVHLQGSDAKFPFAGAIERDTLTVSARSDDGVYTLRTTRATTVSAQPPLVPRNPLDTSAAAVRRSFTEVSRWVLNAASLVPADRFDYRPTETVRTFGQLVAHVADAYSYYCGRAAGRNVDWSDAIEKGTTDKTALLEQLSQAQTECDVVYASASQIGPLVENVGHTSLHYGNMVTYLRMLGLVPPSS